MANSSRLKYLLTPQAWTSRVVRGAHCIALRTRKFSGAIPQSPLTGSDALPEELRSTLFELSKREQKPSSILSDPCAFGGSYQHERIRAVAEYSVKHYPGDIVEIGCYLGETTRILAQVAAASGRRVLALDPWEIGTQNCSGWEYQEFLKNTQKYKSSIDIIRLSSLAPEAIAEVKARQLCMAYVDGLHTYGAALTDIRTVSHCCGPIIVDDVSYAFEVMLAMREGAHELGRSAVHLPSAKEGYLIDSYE